MNSEILKKYHALLTKGSFIWLCAQKDLFDIKIHDFYFHNDFVLHFDISLARLANMACTSGMLPIFQETKEYFAKTVDILKQ